MTPRWRFFCSMMLGWCWVFFCYNTFLLGVHMSQMPEHPVSQTLWATFSATCAAANVYTAGIFWRLRRGHHGWDALP